MPIKKRTPKNRDHPITPEAVAAFRAGEWLALHRALGLKPWQTSPLDAIGECTSPGGDASVESWPLAVELRAELVEAAGGEPPCR